MAETIYPIIFFSISKSGIEVFNSIQQNCTTLNSSEYSRFVNHATFNEDNTISTSITDLKISLPFESKSKEANYAIVNQNRTEYISLFEKLIDSINTLDNKNYASEKNLNLGSPQIVILSSISSSDLSPLVIPLLKSMDRLAKPENTPDVHLILLYNEDTEDKEKEGYLIAQNSFLKEIESLSARKPYVWLIDKINEKGINIGSKEILYFAISQFIDILFTNANKVNKANLNDGNEQEKLCMYSTFGYSALSFPVNKIEEYLRYYALSRELNLIIKDFDTKYEAIRLKDELKIFINSNGFNTLPEKIVKKDNSEPIFNAFQFNESKFADAEYEIALGKKLGVIENSATLANSTTNDFFHSLEEYDKSWNETTLIDTSQLLDAAKKRELELSYNSIKSEQSKLLDNEGINYSLLFTAMLANNKGAVENSLEGRFSSDIPTLITLQDTFRSVFIGDEVATNEKSLRENSDNSTNKQKLIEQNNEKISNAEESLKRFEETIGVDSPQYTELATKIEVFKEEIKKLTSENENHILNIKDLTYSIEQVKAEFNRDATREKYKLKRTKKIEEGLALIQETEIPLIDKDLTTKYEEKNSKIEARKKFLFYDLIVKPAALLVILLLFNFIAWKYLSFSSTASKNTLIISGIILLVYYIIKLIKLIFINKEYTSLLESISIAISEKKSLLGKFVSLKNEFHLSNFNFERDSISLDMVKNIIDYTNIKQTKIEDLKKIITEEALQQNEFNKSYQFSNDLFEFCIVEKSEIEVIFERAASSKIINKPNGTKMSSCFNDFESTNTLEAFKNAINEEALMVYENKIKQESLKSVLLNESITFTKDVNTTAKFNQLFDSSRPLLILENNPTISSRDIPYIDNILIGYKDNSFQKYLTESGFKLNSEGIDVNNDKIFGVLSIKSNFPSFIINDVENNEEYSRKGISASNKSQYFIDDTSYNYSLIPTLSKIETDEKGNIQMGSILITALTKGIVTYDLNTNKFVNPATGDLGIKLEDLITNWSSSFCYDIMQKAKEEESEIWNYDADEQKEYIAVFKKVWTLLPIKVPAKFHNELSEYLFSIKGTAEDWEEIKKGLKSKK